MKLTDILKSKKIDNNHKIFIIASIRIPFFLSFTKNKQSDLIGISNRSVYRIEEDLTYLKIINLDEFGNKKINLKHIN